MGVSMCSLSKDEQADFHEFQYDMEWDTSEEQEDTDDDNEYFNLAKMGRCMSLPNVSGLETITPTNRTKAKQVLRSRGNSFGEKMNDWQRSSVVNPEAELQAKRWCNLVTDDTLKHLSHTVLIAGSIVETGVAINDELSRQDGLLSTAESDLSISKYETEQLAKTPKGVRCFRSNLKNVIWKKLPKLKLKDFDSRTSSFSNVKLELVEEDVRTFSLSKMEGKSPSLSQDTSKDIHQIQIKAGMADLHRALDMIAVQQMDVASTLHRHEGRFNMFEDQVSTTNSKICRQRRMINRIIVKS